MRLENAQDNGSNNGFKFHEPQNLNLSTNSKHKFFYEISGLDSLNH